MIENIILKSSTLDVLEKHLQQATQHSVEYRKEIIAMGSITFVNNQYLLPISIKHHINEGCWASR